RQPEHELEDDAHDGEEGRVTERAPEARIARDGDVVVDADEGTPEPRHAQIVLVQRLPHRPAEGKDGDGADDRDGGRGERPGESAFVHRVSPAGCAFARCATISRTRVRSTSAFIWRAASCNASSGVACPVSARCSWICSSSESWE